MDNDELKLPQIERYLDGLMTDEEGRAFEQQLRDDPSLQNALDEERFVRAAMLRLRERDLRANLKQWRKERITPRKSTRLGWWFWLAVMIVGLLAFWVIVHAIKEVPEMPISPTAKDQAPLFLPDSNKLPVPQKPIANPSAPSKPTPPKNITTRIPSQWAEAVKELLNSPLGYTKAPSFVQRDAGSADPLTAPNAKFEAAIALNQNKFKEALRWLSRADSTDSQVLQMTAHALFGAERYQEAATAFQKLTQFERHALDARWNLAMCYFAQYPDKQEEYHQEMALLLNGSSHSLRKRAEQWEAALLSRMGR